VHRTVAQVALVGSLGAAIGYLALPYLTERLPFDTGANGTRATAVRAGRSALGAAPRGGASAAPAPPSEPLDDAPTQDDAAALDTGTETAPLELSEAGERNRLAVERAERNDWDGAATLLREATRLEPENDLYRRNLQAALINAAFAELNVERFDAAVARFVEALGFGDRGEIRRGLGYAYYRLGNLDLARVTLERALEQGAGDAETYVTLGQIYLDRHDQEHALAMLDRGLAAGSERPGLADTVARLRREADAEKGFLALASSHFVLKFEGRENTAAGRLVLNGLEDAYRRVGARFAYYPLERLEVVLYPDQAFREVTNSPHWSGGMYDGRIKLPIGGLERGNDRVSRTLRHEYAHAAIVTLSHGKAPVWLNEGLAQVAEESGDEGRSGRLKAAVAAGGLLRLATLENGFTHLDRDQASLAYAEAYFAADYLLRKKGGYNVRRLLEALAKGEGTDAAFRQTLALGYADFDQQFLTDVTQRLG
jgi:tetratricopeptide (TPR) repeat protein